MARGKFDIYVYAHWKEILDPKLMGKLSAHYGKGKKVFSFEYDENWITSREQILIDPDIQFFEGPQYPNNKPNFGVFLDSMPDTWGKLMTGAFSILSLSFPPLNEPQTQVHTYFE